jgi:hypothetical protein
MYGALWNGVSEYLDPLLVSLVILWIISNNQYSKNKFSKMTKKNRKD